MSDELEKIIEIAINLAYEAGKWHGQVELEEHFEREQYSSVIPEAINSRKTSSPGHTMSNGNTVRINLRSNKWRNGVKKDSLNYKQKALELVKNYKN